MGEIERGEEGIITPEEEEEAEAEEHAEEIAAEKPTVTNEAPSNVKKKKKKLVKRKILVPKMVSPLKSLLGPLKVFRWMGGFPLKEVNDDGLEWELHGVCMKISWIIAVVVMLYFT